MRLWGAEKGFSLLELLIVLVIIGAVFGFVGPRLAGSMGNLNLKTASKKIAASLRYARSQATTQGTDYVVLFDFDKHRVSLMPKAGESMDEIEDADDEGPMVVRPKEYDLPDGVRFEKAFSGEVEADIYPFEVLFFSDGGSSGGEVILANERDRRYGVLVDFITGAVQVRYVED